jgi:TRAP-type uncharacterized transport system fused permease subunit
VRIGAAGFIVPFMFVYEPAMLMIGTWTEIAHVFASGVVGCLALAAGLHGYLVRTCAGWERAALVAAALLLVTPGIVSDLVGLAIVLAMIGWQRAQARAR